jgi:hypothetical protein
MWCYGLDRSGSGWEQVAGIVNEVMNLRVTYSAGNFLSICKQVSCSRRNLLHTVSNLLVSKNRLAGRLSLESRVRSELHN